MPACPKTISLVKQFFYVQLLSNPANNFQYYRKQLKKASIKSKIPYLTLIAKDIYWVTRDLNYNEDLFKITQRCQITTGYMSDINRESGLNPDCANCAAGKSCKILNGLCSLKHLTDDGKWPYYYVLITV